MLSCDRAWAGGYRATATDRVGGIILRRKLGSKQADPCGRAIKKDRGSGRRCNRVGGAI